MKDFEIYIEDKYKVKFLIWLDEFNEQKVQIEIKKFINDKLLL